MLSDEQFRIPIPWTSRFSKKLSLTKSSGYLTLWLDVNMSCVLLYNNYPGLLRYIMGSCYRLVTPVLQLHYIGHKDLSRWFIQCDQSFIDLWICWMMTSNSIFYLFFLVVSSIIQFCSLMGWWCGDGVTSTSSQLMMLWEVWVHAPNKPITAMSKSCDSMSIMACHQQLCWALSVIQGRFGEWVWMGRWSMVKFALDSSLWSGWHFLS